MKVSMLAVLFAGLMASSAIAQQLEPHFRVNTGSAVLTGQGGGDDASGPGSGGGGDGPGGNTGGEPGDNTGGGPGGNPGDETGGDDDDDTETELPDPVISISNGEAFVGRVFSLTPTIAEVVSPATWTHTGNLPSWAQINGATGEIYGTPLALAATGTDIVLNVVDANGKSASTSPISITTAYPFTATSPTNQVWRIGGSATAALTTTATPPLTYAVTSGPSWLTVASDGKIGGTPTVTGTYNYQIMVSKADVGFTYASGSIDVQPALAFVSQPSNMSAEAGDTTTMNVSLPTGLMSPVTRAIIDTNGSEDSVPEWLYMNTSGRVTAEPEADVETGVYGPFMIYINDRASAPVTSNQFTVTVTAP